MAVHYRYFKKKRAVSHLNYSSQEVQQYKEQQVPKWVGSSTAKRLHHNAQFSDEETWTLVESRIEIKGDINRILFVLLSTDE